MLFQLMNQIRSLRAPSIISNIGWYTGERVLRLISQVVVGALTARYLGPSTYGHLAAAAAIVGILSFFASFGIESLVLRELSKQPRRAEIITSNYLTMRLVGALFIPLIGLGYLQFTSNPDILVYFLMLSLVPVGMSWDVVDLWLQSMGSARSSTTYKIFALALSSVSRLLFLLFNPNPIIICITMCSEALFLATIYIIVARKAGLKISMSYIDIDFIKRILWDGRFLILSAIPVVMYSRIDMLIVSASLNNEEVGLYAVSATIYAAWNGISLSVMQAFAPNLASERQKNIAMYRHLLRQSFILMATVSISGVLGCLLIGKFAIIQIYGTEYIGSFDFLNILLLASIFSYLGVWSSQILLNEDLMHFSAIRTSIGLVLSLIFTPVFAINYGAKGVAVAVLISAAGATLSMLLFAPARRATLLILPVRGRQG